MSSTHAVTIKCDNCNKTSANTTGSYCRPEWIKINIEKWVYDKSSSPVMHRQERDHFDYCDLCVDKHGMAELTILSAKRSIK